MVEFSEHSAIVDGLRAGTNEGLAAFYDLYADKLYDFARRQLRDAALAADVVHDTVLIVRNRIGQLRDESKFRAWVYAIVRNEIRAKARARSRHVREEYAPEQSVDPDFAGDHDRRELASLIDEAVAGLTEREQEVFHLFARQGLSNDEIAASLELTHANAQKLVQRVRDRIARSAGALLVARQGRKDCKELAVVLIDWDGSFSPLWRKRIARHVDECATCESRRALLLQPGGAVMAAPFLAAPVSLRTRIFDSVANGVQVELSRVPGPRFFRRRGFLGSVAGVAFIVAVAFVSNHMGESPTLVEPTVTSATGTAETSVDSLAAGTTQSAEKLVDSTASAGAPATVSSTTSPPSSNISSPSMTTVAGASKKSTKVSTTVSPAPPSSVPVDATASAGAPTTVASTAPPTLIPATLVATTPPTTAPSTTVAATTPSTSGPTTTVSAKSVVMMVSCKDLTQGGAGIQIAINVTDIDGVKAVVAGRYKSTLSSPTSASGSIYNFYVIKGATKVAEPFIVEVRVTDVKGNVTTAYVETTSKNCA